MATDVSLILGSGAARGLAHIGVIEVLEERGLAVRSVVGCSSGALIGGAYCAGKLDAIKEWVVDLTELDVLRFMDLSLDLKDGIIKGDLVIEQMRTLIGARQIEDLAIPFTAVAADVASRKEVWLSKGDLFAAIRASMAIPGLFTPKRLDGRTLVDGGILNPLPGAATAAGDPSLTIAVSLMGRPVVDPLGPNPPPINPDTIESHRIAINAFIKSAQEKLGFIDKPETPKEQQLGLTEVMFNTFDTMQALISRYRLAGYPPDILIEIPANICESHEFHKAPPLISAGRHWAERALDAHESNTGKRLGKAP